MIVADSGVLIDALRGRDPAAERIELELSSGALATTAVSSFELRSGAGSERAAGQVEAFLSPLVILPFDDHAANAAAGVRRSLESAGTPIGMGDYLIAGICLSRSAVLLTRNRERFARVEGLAFGRLGRS